MTGNRNVTNRISKVVPGSQTDTKIKSNTLKNVFFGKQWISENKYSRIEKERNKKSIFYLGITGLLS